MLCLAQMLHFPAEEAHAITRLRAFPIERPGEPKAMPLDQGEASGRSLAYYRNASSGKSLHHGLRALLKNRPYRILRHLPGAYDEADTMPYVEAAQQVIWPIAPDTPHYISSPYGYRTHPITGRYQMHEGVDIAAAHGSDVLATHDGVVSSIGTHPRLGEYIRVQHTDNEYSLYGHLSEALVSEGMKVSAGQRIGKVGSTGRSTGAHLDYSLRIDGTAVNPMEHLTPPSQLGRDGKTLEFSKRSR